MSVVVTDQRLDLESRARALALHAHGETRNQHDGELYVLHVQRVVERLREMGASPVILSIAWLHDVVEDTDVTLDQIRDEFGDEIHDAVDALTHRRGEPRFDYIMRVGRIRNALIVKMADGQDNQDPARKAALDPDTRARLDRKYQLQNWWLAPLVIHHMTEGAP